MANEMNVEFQSVSAENVKAFGDFLCSLAANGDEKFFHPHPLTRSEAGRIASFSGRDKYFVAICEQIVVGYGMLRGWDEGFTVPSLGIAIHADFRGTGLGRKLMHFLHQEAFDAGATEIRLTVERENTAISFYQRFGYEFNEGLGNSLVGILSLGRG
jgi:ribosomal-protein-alanine N-acetyltransferase